MVPVLDFHEIDDEFSVIMSAQCDPSQMHMEHAQSAQFYAPTKALIKEIRLYPVFILRLFDFFMKFGQHILNIYGQFLC